jgi:uncharacterized protein (TIGR00299 family) protein
MIISALSGLVDGSERLLNAKLRAAGLGKRVGFRLVERGHIRARLMKAAGKPVRYSAVAMRKKIAAGAKAAGLSKGAQRFCTNAFGIILAAETAVHGTKDVHLHELAEEDTIVDIIGAATLLEELGAFSGAHVLALPIGVGSGAGPAAMEILRKARFPFVMRKSSHELCTPTGAALIAAAAKPAEDVTMVAEKVAYGAGKAELEKPNVLRVALGEQKGGANFIILEANIDDMSGEAVQYAAERLMEEGAKDSCIIPIIAKKGRPGVILQALCNVADRQRVLDAMLQETTTWGVREIPVQKHMLERKTVLVRTSLGAVRMKCSTGIEKCKPEFDDVRAIARRKRMPLIDADERISAECGCGRKKQKII